MSIDAWVGLGLFAFVVGSLALAIKYNGKRDWFDRPKPPLE
jgi:hypothetical protein